MGKMAFLCYAYFIRIFSFKGEDVRWIEMVSLRQELGTRDLNRRTYPGRDLERTFLERRIMSEGL